MERFYDVHVHSFDTSHLNLFVLAKNVPLLGDIIKGVTSDKITSVSAYLDDLKDENETSAVIKRSLNLLTYMDNDIGTQFLILEYFIKKDILLYNPETKKIVIGDKDYDKIVICPQTIDFDYNKRKTVIEADRTEKRYKFFDIPVHKPIDKQITDLFNGIRKYYTHTMEYFDDKYRIVRLSCLDKEDKIFEIYPFLGINPLNFDEPEEIQDIMDKYFSEYKGLNHAFYENLGKFNGDLDTLGSNFFAGIKLYPPLGFHPNPYTDRNKAKAECLYDYCLKKKIPITVHSQMNGFCYVTSDNDFSDPLQWLEILNQDKYKDLIINFAHFGGEESWQEDLLDILIDIFSNRKNWKDTIIKFIIEHKNIYTDISELGKIENFYESLKKVVNNERFPGLKEKVLFGSDLMINLIDSESYNEYLYDFSVSRLDFNENAKRFLRVSKDF